MFFENKIKEYGNKKIELYVDMDGVIVDFEVGKPFDYHKKRPLITSLERLEKVSKLENVELFILSISKMNVGIKEKNIWLDEYAPFFKKENRVIISREANDFEQAKKLKANYLKTVDKENKVIIIIDDDPVVLNEINDQCENVVLFKDTVLVD